MLARVMPLHFDTVLGSFDDMPLREFLKDKEVLSIRNHFFIRNDVPYLTMIVMYTLPHPIPPAALAAPMTPTNQRGPAWRELIADAEVPLFNSLRDWRLQRSKQEGVPPYVICTNKMLAALVQARPQSLTQLGHIEHFGKAKLEKYGQELPAILATASHRQPAIGSSSLLVIWHSNSSLTLKAGAPCHSTSKEGN